jgi:hypothetical protein
VFCKVDETNFANRATGTVDGLFLLQPGHQHARMRSVARPFFELGLWLAAELQDGPQLTIALNTLAAAQSAAVKQGYSDWCEANMAGPRREVLWEA